MRYLSRQYAAIAGLALLACGEGKFEPTVETVAGGYHATTLVVIQGSSSTDLLLGGGLLTLNLDENGTTSGRLFIPGGGEGGGDLDVDLPGTWTLADSTVTFVQPDSDTFIRDMPFTAQRNRLRGEETFASIEGDFTLSVVLTK